MLSVNGKAELVAQDAERYQHLLEAKERMEAIEGISRGAPSMKDNAAKPAAEFFREFFRENIIVKFAEAIYILHAFEKRTRRTRQADIELAKKNLSEVTRLGLER